jgi:hypothetical protein
MLAAARELRQQEEPNVGYTRIVATAILAAAWPAATELLGVSAQMSTSGAPIDASQPWQTNTSEWTPTQACPAQ